MSKLYGGPMGEGKDKLWTYWSYVKDKLDKVIMEQMIYWSFRE